MNQYLDKIVPQVGDAWRADEVYVKIRGELKYVFAMMDDETRFWIAQEVADRKEGHDARGLLQKSKQVTQTKPKVFITDGLGSYHEAYKKEFWAIKRRNRTLHIRHIHLQGDMNNNKMERLNGEIRDREKAIIIMIFFYFMSFMFLAVQFQYGDMFGVTMKNWEGEELRSPIIDYINTGEINTHTQAALNVDKSATLLDTFVGAATIGWDLFLILSGTYIFRVLELFLIPSIFIAPIVVVYEILLIRALMGIIRGV